MLFRSEEEEGLRVLFHEVAVDRKADTSVHVLFMMVGEDVRPVL